MKFCIDTSVFIESWVRHYPKDVFPSLWEKIEYCIQEKHWVVSIEVFKEIERQEDDLHKWMDKYQHFFCPTDEKIQLEAKKIL